MNKIDELRDLTVEKLQAQLLSLRKEQFNLRMKRASGSLDKPHLIKVVRRSIARVKTLLTEKKGDVELLAKALLKKEVLFKSDVEALIGKRAFEDKKTLDLPLPEDTVMEEPDTSLPEELINPPKI